MDFKVYAQEMFEVQMQEWLEFTWANRDNPIYKTPQTERFKTGTSYSHTVKGKQYLGSQSGMHATNNPNGKMSKSINTYELYKAWKKQSDAVKKTYNQRCFLRYNEAVPEMHVFLDFMQDVMP